MRRALIWGTGAMVLLGIGAVVAVWWTLLRDLPDVETLADYRPPLTSTVLDRNGTPIGEFFEERRRLVDLDEIPEYVVHAFLAAEDDTFYEHRGVDYVSIMRAASAVVMAGGSKVQGGSTITQQLVKQLLLSPEQTYTRKIRELYLAQQVEDRFDKQEILYLYLNHIYFGSGAHGIGEAARTYFDKDVADVTIGEAALLGGLPKKPGRNSPFLDPVAAEERRRYVLSRMLEEGFIDAAEHEAALAPIALANPNANPFAAAGYVVEEVRRRLVEILGNDIVLNGGLTIESTVDLKAQEAAIRAVQEGVEALDQRRGYRGPVRQIDPGALDAERAFLAKQNRIVDGELPVDFFDAPHEAVVLSVDKKTARVAFGGDFEAELGLKANAWAHPAEDESKHGEEIDRLDKVFSVGDVARFRVQAPAEDASDTELGATLYQLPDAQGALISIDLETRDVVAMVGGYDFAESEFNRAIQAQRQPGSAFKPIVYAAAVAHGYTPASILHDRPVVYTDEASGFVFRPENYGRRFLGALTMTEALARSVNNAAIHLLRDVGIDRVMKFAETLGIHSPLERVLGLALGGSPVTLLELTRAYGVLGSGGRYVDPRLVARVIDRDGRVILEDVALDPLAPAPEPNFPDEVAASRAEADPSEAEPAPAEPEPQPAKVARQDEGDETIGLDIEPDAPKELPGPRKPPAGHVMHPSEAYLAASLLRAVVEHPNGTGRRALRLNRPLAGKTGTTNDNTDAWFVGFSPELATGVWVGIDEKQVLGRRETGGRAAAPIWVDFMGEALAQRPVRDFETPSNIVFARVDAKTGKLASPTSESTLFQAFISGTEPTERTDPTASGSDPGGRLRLDF